VTVKWNVQVPMRDGTALSADVYFAGPAGTPATTLLARTPYNKNTLEARKPALAYGAKGYNFVWMDVRGRGDSGGEFIPYRNEAEDGFDSIEWIARQPWSDGRIVTWGGSYLGYIQWMTALLHPPHLTAMIVYVTTSDLLEDYPTGQYIPLELCWYRYVDGRVVQYIEDTDWEEIASHLPVISLDERAGFYSQSWRTGLAHPVSDAEFWNPVRYQEKIAEVTVPVLHITGWYDDAQRGTMVNFTRLTSPTTAASIRDNQWLIVGPWGHYCFDETPQQLGRVDFGAAAAVDLPAWEQQWLAGVLEDGAKPTQVRVFVMGKNQWREEHEWPLARTQWTPFLLASDGSANSRHGDGRLCRSEAPRPAGTHDRFTYDPADPVPFISDSETHHQIGGPDDYSEIENRADILVYTTEPLDHDLEITGPVRLILYAASSAVDTDFTAKLLDVHPDGLARRLCDGMIRARFRLGYREPPTLLEPGAISRYEIDLWSTSHVFLAGHCIRLEISSSAFPKYDRNLNTGADLATGTEMLSAHNTVWHDADHPSQLILPEVRTHS